MSAGASLHAEKHSVLSQCVWAVSGILGVPYGPHYGAANFLTEVPYLVLVLLSPQVSSPPTCTSPIPACVISHLAARLWQLPCVPPYPLSRPECARIGLKGPTDHQAESMLQPDCAGRSPSNCFQTPAAGSSGLTCSFAAGLKLLPG